MPYHRDQKRHEIAGMLERIRSAVYVPLAPLTVTAFATKEPVSFANRETGRRLELKPGDVWGGLFDCAWFHFTGSAPEEAEGHPLVLLIDVNGEACVVDGDGNPMLGLTTKNSEYDYSLGRPGKRVVPIAAEAAGGDVIDLWADAGCNDLFGRLVGGGTLLEADVAICRPNMRSLEYDWEVLHELMTLLPDGAARRHRIWSALCKAARELNDFTDDEAEAARAILAPELAKRGGDPSLTVSAVGHAHMDLAWLWPIRETIRKGARTFSTVLANMDRYPDYVFGASQPQYFQWMKDHYPALYERIKARVLEGRLEAQGAMWVEADTNVPSGEALVRQVLHGKRFYRSEFGLDVKNLWLPDVFGYSGSLPQILRKAGVETFMTQKLSWSLLNRYPHHTFLWQGIDGSQVLAHLPPEDTYNSSAAPRAIMKAERGFLDKEISERCLLVFGIGDGGGGPGEEHLERLMRMKNLEGLVPVVQEPSHRFFERIGGDVEQCQVWRGELYLERHQGTFTTQARNKRYNRKLEIALRETETTCVRAMLAGGYEYPQAAIEAIWKEMLLYQFHDILPGSSITRVYTESLERYAAMTAELEAIRRAAEGAVLGGAGRGAGPRRAAVNGLSWTRSEFACVDGRWRRITAPALAAAPVPDMPAQFEAPTASPDLLENGLIRVAFSSDGSVASLIDKRCGREALMNPGNRLAVYRDPGDAWDFALDYDAVEPDHFKLESSSAEVDGPEARVHQVYRFGASTLRQTVVVTADSPRVDFRTEVDWRENARMLRTSFPTTALSEEATFEIQFGSLRRNAHTNTSWDLGKFEVCGHRWVDVSERGWGIALLNDCKYGHQVRDGVLDLNLLRSPHFPDPVADRAEHRFTYALLPHAGDHVEGEVLQAAAALNSPLRIIPCASMPEAQLPLVSVDLPNIVIETVKKAEDSDDVIVRMYEADGRTCHALIAPGFLIESADRVNLMEEPYEVVPVEDDVVEIGFGPFEIVTLMLRPA